jgi:hypothetical protein
LIVTQYQEVGVNSLVHPVQKSMNMKSGIVVSQPLRNGTMSITALPIYSLAARSPAYWRNDRADQADPKPLLDE